MKIMRNYFSILNKDTLVKSINELFLYDNGDINYMPTFYVLQLGKHLHLYIYMYNIRTAIHVQ